MASDDTRDAARAIVIDEELAALLVVHEQYEATRDDRALPSDVMVGRCIRIQYEISTRQTALLKLLAERVDTA